MKKKKWSHVISLSQINLFNLNGVVQVPTMVAFFRVSPKNSWEVCIGLGWTMAEGINGVAT